MVEIQKAALFDFNLTLPVIMDEFLLLMFALDKIYFSLLGCFKDKRDASIMHKLVHFMNQPRTPSPVMTARTFDRVVEAIGR